MRKYSRFYFGRTTLTGFPLSMYAIVRANNKQILQYMKKIFVVAAVLLAALTAKAEVVSRDTVAYTGTYRLEKIEKSNDYGEISVRYVCYLDNVTNSKGEPRKVNVTKKDYESGKIDALVYNNNADGSRRIAKAVNTNKQ